MANAESPVDEPEHLSRFKERPTPLSSRRRVTGAGGAGVRIETPGSDNLDPGADPTAGLAEVHRSNTTSAYATMCSMLSVPPLKWLEK